MAREVFRVFDLSITASEAGANGTKVFTFANLTEESGATIPATFNNAPKAYVQTLTNRGLYISAISTTTVTVGVKTTGVGGPWIFDLYLTNLDSTSVTGPTPSADFSLDTIELFSTPLDIRLEHKEFNPNMISDGELTRYLIMSKHFIKSHILRLYVDSSMKTINPLASPVYESSVWADPGDEVENRTVSKRKFSKASRGWRSIAAGTNKDTVFTQYYTIVFTSATAYSVTGHVEGSMGTGTTGLDFVAGNGDFTIAGAADFGTFKDKNEFFFAIHTFDPIIVYASTLIATAMALMNEYGIERDEESGLAKAKMKAAKMILVGLQKPDDADGMRLSSLGDPDLSPEALPSDIDWLGFDRTNYAPGNKDSLGRSGEFFDFFTVGFDGFRTLWGGI